MVWHQAFKSFAVIVAFISALAHPGFRGGEILTKNNGLVIESGVSSTTK
jgi:hypothetical protein